jgi:hypothetical protein
MKTLSLAVAALLTLAACSTETAQAGDYCYAPPSCHVSSYVPAIAYTSVYTPAPACAPTCAPTCAPAPVCRTFTVLYRDCPHSGWAVYGTFHRVQDVIRTANYIEGLGYETLVR